MAELIESEYEGNISWNDNGDLLLGFDSGSIITVILPEGSKFILPSEVTVIYESVPIKITFEVELKGETEPKTGSAKTSGALFPARASNRVHVGEIHLTKGE